MVILIISADMHLLIPILLVKSLISLYYYLNLSIFSIIKPEIQQLSNQSISSSPFLSITLIINLLGVLRGASILSTIM